MKLRRKGLGWLWPAQACGKSYKDFRAGISFKEAYDWLAFRANERGETFRPSQKRIVGQMAAMKREMYEQYQKGCEAEARGGKPAKTWDQCRRVCRIRSRPCGKTCVSKKKNCRKPPAPDVCDVMEFQTVLPLDVAAAERWEEARAAGAAMPEEGDTSFDFAIAPTEPTVPVDDDIDFGYEAPSRYGFTGLRGAHVARMGVDRRVPDGTWFEWSVPFSKSDFDDYRKVWATKRRNETVDPRFRTKISKADEARFRAFQKKWKQIGYDPDETPALPINVRFAGGRGGAAAGRGKYKPLPSGQGAIEQHRALERAREQIIRAVESGELELCKPASRSSPHTTPPGNRTASEWEAVRRRMERAGY